MSDKAAACPKCKTPCSGVDPEALERAARVLKRERQRKLQMRQMLTMLAFASGAGLIVYAGGGTGKLSMLGSSLAVLGFLGYTVTRVQLALTKKA